MLLLDPFESKTPWLDSLHCTHLLTLMLQLLQLLQQLCVSGVCPVTRGTVVTVGTETCPYRWLCTTHRDTSIMNRYRFKYTLSYEQI